MTESIRKKIVIVGDGAAGKTSLLIVFTSGNFPVNHIPTVFDNHLVDVFLDNQVIQLALWDTAGQEDYARLRPLSYPGTDCLLVCFAIDNPTSFDNVDLQWRGELSHYCPRVPFLLIGCKTDLRQNPETIAQLAAQGKTPITYVQGVSMAQRIGAWRYMECSAMLNEGVSDVFEYSTRAACWQMNQTSAPAAASTESLQHQQRSNSNPRPPSGFPGRKGKKKECALM
ncbi:GTP-binding protein Rho1 [Chytriomyces hyalinus]|nr:GTP-binding protein Rho1 [Chytriomyces hyalinus]KAJ3398964.1 GTP-binding protein Rho1 [Chytriomyces hyalinus]